MYKIYGDILSGNCYKIRLLMQFIGLGYKWFHVDVLSGETYTEEFKRMNPSAQIPVVDLGNDLYLWESNAILNYFAEGTEFLPRDDHLRAKILQWQFFEQYSHEPYIATARYIHKYLGLPDERKAEYQAKQAGGHKALSVMNEHLDHQKYFVGDSMTIADITLYAYTHVAEEGGFELSAYSNVIRWIKDFESTSGFIKMVMESP